MVSEYTDVTEDWQACLTRTFYTVPITDYVATQSQATQTCVINQFLFVSPTQCNASSINCVKQLQQNCLGSTPLQVRLIQWIIEISII